MAKSVKKVVPAKAPVAKPQAVTNGKTIQVLVANPKRGAFKVRFGFYRNGISVEDYVARCVKAGSPAKLAHADLRWDEQRKFIAIR